MTTKRSWPSFAPRPQLAVNRARRTKGPLIDSCAGNALPAVSRQGWRETVRPVRARRLDDLREQVGAAEAAAQAAADAAQTAVTFALRLLRVGSVPSVYEDAASAAAAATAGSTAVTGSSASIAASAGTAAAAAHGIVYP